MHRTPVVKTSKVKIYEHCLSQQIERKYICYLSCVMECEFLQFFLLIIQTAKVASINHNKQRSKAKSTLNIMVVLTEKVYKDVTVFIRKYRGLSMDCDVALKEKFPEVESKTLESILAREWQHLIKQKYPHIVSHARRFLRE